MIIACIIISSLCLLAVIVLILLTVKRKDTKQDVQIDLKEIGAIQKQLDMISGQMRTEIELAVKKEISEYNAQSIKVNETNNEKLERFQKNINETLTTRFDTLFTKTSKDSESNNDKLERFQRNITESLLQRFDALNKQIDEKLLEINKKVDEKLAEGFKGTSETMAEVRERLQAIDTAQRNIEKLSGDVVSLKQVLEGNQSRGRYGEYQLSMVLNSIFGDATGCYEEQYTIKKVKDGDDVRADAVVFMPEPNKMICIDSKFPFQDYSKLFETETDEEKERLTKDFANAVKKHITAIKDKYIVEGKTAPEALMFIPNDGVFAFIHHNLESVVEYAREQRVVITSPSTLPAILVTINMVRIEVERSKNLEEINKNLRILGKQFGMFSKEWESFSRQLETVTRSREKLDTRVNRITNRFDAISMNDDTELIGENNSNDEE